MKHSVGKLLTAGAATTLFTVPNGFKAEVSLLFISNHTGNNKTISAYWQHAHDPSHQIIIIDGYQLAATEFIKFDGSTIIMQAGDSIVLTAQAGSAMSAIATFNLYKEAATYAFDGE
jgi:uncharacterized protein YjlB